LSWDVGILFESEEPGGELSLLLRLKVETWSQNQKVAKRPRVVLSRFQSEPSKVKDPLNRFERGESEEDKVVKMQESRFSRLS